MPKKTKRTPKPLADFTLPDQIIAAREAAELSRRQLAKKCKVDYTTVAHWEQGVYIPSPDNLKALAKACKCDYVLAQLIPAQLIPAADPGGASPTE